MGVCTVIFTSTLYKNRKGPLGSFFVLNSPSCTYNTFMRLLRYALNNIKRSLVLSLSSIVVISLMTFLIFALFFTEFVMRSLAESVNSRLSLTLNVKTGFSSTSREIIDTLGNLEKIAPGIVASFASAKDNFEVLRTRDPELAKIIDDESQNPLPSTISVKNVSIEQYETLGQVILKSSKVLDINEEKHAKSVINYRNQFERIRTVISVLYSLRFGLYCIIGFFLFSVFVVIFHSIGNTVFFFSEEIKITQLVGGQKRYIYGPFIIQGMIYSALAIAISGALFYYGMYAVGIDTFLGSTHFIDNFFSQSGELFIFVGLSVVFLGALSGFVSSWKFTK